MAPTLSTTDLKLARFRNDVLAAYAESRGVDLTRPSCGRCGCEYVPEDPLECDTDGCPLAALAEDAS